MTTTPIAVTPTIRALTGIRIVAAAWVVVEHFRQPLFAYFPIPAPIRDVIASGYLGVELFFILSGFIISHNYAHTFERFTVRGYRHFLALRLARLYPVHLVMLLTVGVLAVAAGANGVGLTAPGRYTVTGFTMNVLLLQALPPGFAWDGPAWSISAEAGAYLAFPVLALALARVRGRGAVLLVVAGCCVIPVAGAVFADAHGPYGPTLPIVVLARICGEFTAGCFLWAFWSRHVRVGRAWDAVAAIAAVGVVAVIVMTPGSLSPADFLTLPFIALFVVACASATGPIARVLSMRWMDYGGRISYSLYMWHFVVLMVAGKLLPWPSFTGAGLVQRVAVLGGYYSAALLGAVVLYHVVEEPGRKMIRRWTARPVIDLTDPHPRHDRPVTERHPA